jgi:hypothetical protein
VRQKKNFSRSPDLLEPIPVARKVEAAQMGLPCLPRGTHGYVHVHLGRYRTYYYSLMLTLLR